MNKYSPSSLNWKGKNRTFFREGDRVLGFGVKTLQDTRKDISLESLFFA